MHKYAQICTNMQWPLKYVACAFICVYMYKICKNMQDMKA